MTREELKGAMHTQVDVLFQNKICKVVACYPESVWLYTENHNTVILTPEAFDEISFRWQKKNNDAVNSPSHYTDGKIEVIEYIEDKQFDFHIGNAIKYLSRAGKKDPNKTVEDLNKAIWYIQRKIKLLSKDTRQQ